jgi:hypothetical protein
LSGVVLYREPMYKPCVYKHTHTHSQNLAGQLVVIRLAPRIFILHNIDRQKTITDAQKLAGKILLFFLFWHLLCISFITGTSG